MTKEIVNGVDLTLIKNKVFFSSLGSENEKISLKSYSLSQCLDIIDCLQELQAVDKEKVVSFKSTIDNSIQEIQVNIPITGKAVFYLSCSYNSVMKMCSDDSDYIRIYAGRKLLKSNWKYSFSMYGHGYLKVPTITPVHRTLRICRKLSNQDIIRLNKFIDSCIKEYR